ncbi:hypothetical protein R6Q59_015140 [Mikania micrantha]
MELIVQSTIATWPIYAKQRMNNFKMVMELGLVVGRMCFVPQDNTVTVTAEEIESGIRRVMENNEVGIKVKEMSKKSNLSVVEGARVVPHMHLLVILFKIL